MRYYKRINIQYGADVTSLMKKYAKQTRKQSQQDSSKQFLLKCRKYSLIPKFIKRSTINACKLLSTQSKFKKKLNNIVLNFHYKLLNVIIQDVCAAAYKSDCILHNLQESILNEIPYDVADNFLQQQKQYFDLNQIKIKTVHNRKFDDLYNELFHELDFNIDEKAFVNLTTVVIPKNICWLLSLGPKFALPNSIVDFPLFDVIADTECIVNTIKEEKNKDIARAKIASIVSNVGFIQHNQRKNIIDATIQKIYEDTMQFFKSHNDLIIVTSDKGKATVIMFKNSYEEKVKVMLSDKQTYKILQANPLNSLQIKNNKFVDRLHKLNIIDKKEKFKLSTYNSTDPKLYALPKIHKPNIPFRPVTACINTSTSPLSHMLSPIIKNLTNSDPYNINNSFVFKEKIAAAMVDDDDVMVSFDIVSLFTNIPVGLAIEIIDERWIEIQRYTSIPKVLFFEILNFCLVDGNYCVFRSTAYQQIFGMPMGNPLSTVIADIITRKLLDNVMEKLTFQPKLFVKYVDDIFAIIPRNSVDDTLSLLNAFHPRLKFTVETEVEGKIPYLDIMVSRGQNNKLDTDWYRKSVSSSRILNFHSHHPTSQKTNTALNFISRVFDLSSQKFHNSNKLVIKNILSYNNYPKKTINELIAKYYNRKRNNSNKDVLGETENRNSTHQCYRALTYVKGISEKINHVVKACKPEVQLAYKTTKNLKNVFTRLKDKVPLNKQTNVVYKIPCLGDANGGPPCQLSYVGQTKQYLEKRLNNHRRDILKSGDQSLPKTALVDHYLAENHYPDFGAATVLTQADHYGRRLTMETLHILNENTMNFKRDTDNISAIYCSVIKNDCNQKHKRKRTSTTPIENIIPHNKKQRTV